MPLSPNINNREFNKFIKKRGTRVKVTSIPNDGNSIDVVTTNVGTSAVKIDMPAEASEITLLHREAGETLYIGGSNEVTTATGFPVLENDAVGLSLKLGNDNEVYGIAASGTIEVYAIGVIAV